MQDVFIIPSRKMRDDQNPQPWYRYGTTIRWYDPAIDAWRVTFFDPNRRIEQRQIARNLNGNIIQLDENHDGVIRRWQFTEITKSAFRWIGEVSWDNGGHWRFALEMRARRIEK